MKNLPQIAFENYKLFESKSGSDHIATFSSQLNLLEQLAGINPGAVLDFGSGIGTLTKLVQQSGVKDVFCYEKSEWCKLQAQENLKPFSPVYFSELSDLPLIEVVIIDDEISRKQIYQLLRQPNLKLIFIEGWRNKTASQISHRLPWCGYGGIFVRGVTKWNQEWTFSQDLQQFEKAGCWFLIQKQNRILAGLNWMKRIRATGEIKEVIKEFYFWSARTVRVRSRLKSRILDSEIMKSENEQTISRILKTRSRKT